MSAGTTIKVTVTAAQSTNYNAASATYTLTITKANNPVSVTANTGIKYGASTALVTTKNAQGTVYYAVGTQLTASNYTTSGSTTVPTASGRNQGSYVVYYYVAGNTNYNPSSGSVTTSIARTTGSVTLKPTSGSVAYGTAQATFQATGTGTLSVSDDNSTATSSISGSTVTIGNIGSLSAGTTIKVTVKAAQSTNYEAASATYTLTITTTPAGCPTTTDYKGYFNNAPHYIGVSGGSGGTIQYSTDNSNWSTTNPSRTVSGRQTTYVRVVGDSNHSTVTCTSRTITIDAVTVTTTFNPNGNSISGATGYAPNGGVEASCSGNATTTTCTCSIGNSYGCGIKAGTLISTGNGFGFSTSSAGGSTVVWKYGDQKTIYYDTPSTTYYAQSSKTYKATFSYSDSPGIATSSSSSQSCTIYNNSSSTCTINTLPTLTATTGNTVAGWYDSSGNKVTSISLSSNQTFTARANITAAGVTYTDTYSMGCSTVQCAIDKISTFLK